MEKVFYGSRKCQAINKSKNIPCNNGAYYEQNGKYLCGMHSDKAKRTILPKDKNASLIKEELIFKHNISVDKYAKTNREKGEMGEVVCYKMGMMKNVPLVKGYLNVFPNNKHQNRIDGFGCCSLSPMRLGPVKHRQPDLPDSLTIENYHQFNKVYPNELDEDENILPIFYERQLKAYQDEVPHRHKFDSKEMSKLRKEIDGENINQPSFSLHKTLDGEERRFTYVESRYFYCKAYEILAPQTDDFIRLKDKIEDGVNIIICGYDAYPITKSLYDRDSKESLQGKSLRAILYEHYCDPVKAFGHELVLYTLLTVDDENEYPWNVYRKKHSKLYKNMAYAREI